MSRKTIGGLLGVACMLGLASCGTPEQETTPKKAVNEAKASKPKGEPAKVGEAPRKEEAPAAPPTEESTEPVQEQDNEPPPTGMVSTASDMVRRGQYEQAVTQCRAALRRKEKYVPAMVVMARAYYQLGKYEFAESVCDIALNIDGTTGECHNLKGFIALKQNSETEALKHFEKATQVKPGYGPAWLNLGAQYVRVKNYTSAVTALEKAVELMPSRAEAHLNLGSAYRGDNKLVKAQQSYQQALRLKPGYPDVYFNLGILFLDAKEFPGMTRMQALDAAVQHFTRYKSVAAFRAKDDPVDDYVTEAQKAAEREKKRLEREAQQKARDAAKKPAKEDKKAAKEEKKPAAGAPKPAPATKKPSTDTGKKPAGK
ncbi:MAG: tetratricopeptide repeat protein [Deltaproteobacteria bacterium]|nr:tetratricopeptide repeat protein [Deltaproteobacteria bacterium]